MHCKCQFLLSWKCFARMLVANTSMNETEHKKEQLIQILQRYGYPREFGTVIAAELRTEKAMNRMISYLLQGKPSSAEEIADEMIAIEDDRQRWIQKKTAEYNNQKYNELLAGGVDDRKKEES